MISKGKFRHLRELYGYNDFVMYKDLKTGFSTGYHRGKVYHNMYPISGGGPAFDCTGVNVTLNYRVEV
jgi:hypothetical protein